MRNHSPTHVLDAGVDVNFVFAAPAGTKPKKDDIPAKRGVTLYFSASSPQKSALSSFNFPGFFSAKLFACEKSSKRVIQLPDIFFRIVDARRESRQDFRTQLPRNAAELTTRDPSVSIHCSIGKNFEVLLRMPFCRFAIVECVSKADAVHWHLFDTVHLLRRRNIDGLEIVGTTSITCVNRDRNPTLSVIRFGHETTIGLRVPPK